ncbi:MAG: hypothetical protein ICV72_13140, partial [Aldersonia sp.]|nr:hypothetical protein [Aldersonia sp.]
DAHCGFTALTELRAEVPPGIMTYAGYGKGVTFWESTDDASKFVNEFQDLVSVNNYWFTDSTTCRQTEGGKLITNGERTLTSDECHRAANYGVTTRYVRSLIEPFGSKPFWNLIEVGHPSATDSEPTITAAQIRGAVWSSIINGARGIIYFNHSFGGPCLSFNVLRDRCGDDVRAEVTAVNHQIQRLATVLNSPFVDGLVQSDAPVDIAAKMHDGSFYIMVGNKQNAPTEATILLSCGNASRVEVIDENRQLPMANGAFHDTFTDGNAVHLYRVVDGDTCGLPN